MKIHVNVKDENNNSRSDLYFVYVSDVLPNVGEYILLRDRCTTKVTDIIHIPQNIINKKDNYSYNSEHDIEIFAILSQQKHF